MSYYVHGGAALESVSCDYAEWSAFSTWWMSDEVGSVAIDSDGAVHMLGLGSAGVSSAGVGSGCVSVPVSGKFVTGAYYTEGYSSVLPTELDLLVLFPAVSSALGGYMTSSEAVVTGCHCSSGEISDDVVGEVPDKIVKSTGSLHLGGFVTVVSVVEG